MGQVANFLVIHHLEQFGRMFLAERKHKHRGLLRPGHFAVFVFYFRHSPYLIRIY